MSQTSLILIVICFLITLGLGGYIGWNLHKCPVIEHPPVTVTVVPETVTVTRLNTVVVRKFIHDTLHVISKGDTDIFMQSYSLDKTVEIPIEAHVTGVDTIFHSTITQDVSVSFDSAPINEFTNLRITPHPFTIPGTITQVVRTERRFPLLWLQGRGLYHNSTGGLGLTVGIGSVGMGAGFLVGQQPIYEISNIWSF